MANVRWVMGKAREFQKSVYCCFVDYAQAFACVDHGKLWTILREMGIPDPLTCLSRLSPHEMNFICKTMETSRPKDMDSFTGD